MSLFWTVQSIQLVNCHGVQLGTIYNKWISDSLCVYVTVGECTCYIIMNTIESIGSTEPRRQYEPYGLLFPIV